MHRGIATFTLDYGKCPPWLFERMVKLGREMTRVLIEEYGPNEFIKRISDPVWWPTYDQTIETLKKVVVKSKISPLEKDKALKRLRSS